MAHDCPRPAALSHVMVQRSHTHIHSRRDWQEDERVIAGEGERERGRGYRTEERVIEVWNDVK